MIEFANTGDYSEEEQHEVRYAAVERFLDGVDRAVWLRLSSLRQHSNHLVAG